MSEILSKEQIEAYAAWVEKKFIPQLNGLPLPTTEEMVASHEASRRQVEELRANANQQILDKCNEIGALHEQLMLEREACAKVAEEISKECDCHECGQGRVIAKAIRERK